MKEETQAASPAAITAKAINSITPHDLLTLEENIGYMDSIDEHGNAFDLYQNIALKSAIYPGQGTVVGLNYVGLKGAGEAGEFAEHVGKAMRDDGLISVESSPSGPRVILGALTPERRELLRKECGDELWYLAAKARELGFTLSDIAIGSIAKIVKRTSSGTLQGSGDNR